MSVPVPETTIVTDQTDREEILFLEEFGWEARTRVNPETGAVSRILVKVCEDAAPVHGNVSANQFLSERARQNAAIKDIHTVDRHTLRASGS